MNDEPLGLDECTGCHRLIRWAITVKNRRPIPLDAVPSDAYGTMKLDPNPDPTDTRRLAVFVPPRERVGKLWVPHHSTCPTVERFRKPPVGGHTPAEQALARLQLQAAELEADRLADELIDLTRAKQDGRFPTYLECRVEWPGFVAAHPKADRRVLKLVSAAALRKLHPREAALGSKPPADAFPGGAPQ